jgi:arsenate reductase
MAEAIVNARRGEQWEAVSAGTQPTAQVHPKALAALAEIGIQPDGQRPTHVSAFHGQTFDLIVTVCDSAAENCPIWPGQGRRVHLGFPDPATATGTNDEAMAVFRAVRDDILQKLPALLDEYAAESSRIETP